MIFNVNSLKYKNMRLTGEEIPAIAFLISSIGFVILTYIQYRNNGKSFNTIFLSMMATIFFVSYIILLISR